MVYRIASLVLLALLAFGCTAPTEPAQILNEPEDVSDDIAEEEINASADGEDSITPPKDNVSDNQPMEDPKPDTTDESDQPALLDDWRDAELTDTLSGETFRISDFKGKPVLLESFAVWCPVCLQQQKEIKKLKESDGDAIIHISLDTDPNEDAAAVIAHAGRNGLDWYFAISPTSLTEILIDEFGFSFVNAPSAPVVLICEDQSTRFLRGGVKSADELKTEIGNGC
jgi:thiol-disulfide isomerase/thioredoxin